MNEFCLLNRFALVAMGALAIGTLMEELFCYSIKKHQMFNPKVCRALEQVKFSFLSLLFDFFSKNMLLLLLLF
jgi:hypothetical protein